MRPTTGRKYQQYSPLEAYSTAWAFLFPPLWPISNFWYGTKIAKIPKFSHHFVASQETADIHQVFARDARAFIKHLMEWTTRYSDHVLRNELEGGLAPTTSHGYGRSMRTFASWLQREGYTDENIFEGLKPPNLPQILIQPLTEDEIRTVLLLIPPASLTMTRSPRLR